MNPNSYRRKSSKCNGFKFMVAYIRLKDPEARVPVYVQGYRSYSVNFNMGMDPKSSRNMSIKKCMVKSQFLLKFSNLRMGTNQCSKKSINTSMGIDRNQFLSHLQSSPHPTTPSSKQIEEHMYVISQCPKISRKVSSMSMGTSSHPQNSGASVLLWVQGYGYRPKEIYEHYIEHCY